MRIHRNIMRCKGRRMCTPTGMMCTGASSSTGLISDCVNLMLSLSTLLLLSTTMHAVLVSGSMTSSSMRGSHHNHNHHHQQQHQHYNHQQHSHEQQQQHQHHELPKTRLHPLQRIYGPENAEVRSHVHELERTSTHYFRTGERMDADFKVPYGRDGEGHPLERRMKSSEHNNSNNNSNSNRNLQNNQGDQSLFKPMRITFVTAALDNQRSEDTNNGAKIDFIKNEVLERMANFWSDALSVVPVRGPLKIQKGELAQNMYCGDSEFSKVPDSHMIDGIPNTDLVLYVSATPSSRFCGSSTLAVAVACNFDQVDRPTAGAINFCLNQIKLNGDGSAHESIIQDNVDVAIHEAAHVLGMSSNSYRFFWDPLTTRPRTPRPFKTTTVECVDGVTRTLTIPAENTMMFITADNGQRHASIVTPTVRAVARNQFNCQDLEGAQLENQPTGSNSCTGDHWDERLFYPESLSGVISPTTVVLSPLTLALMEDSGWYAANYTKSTVSPWGHNAGCSFVREPCLIQEFGETVVPDYGKGYFCTKNSQRGCSPSHFYKMGCTQLDYDLFFETDRPPPQFQYFPDNPGYGGLKQADFCPVYGSVYKANAHDLDCRDPANGGGVQLYAEVFDQDSMCYESSTGVGRCYTSRCIYDEFYLAVNVRGEWLKCEEDFQVLDIKGTGGVLAATITCPRLSSACPDMFCPANCAGRGVCNFEAIVNGTTRPQCECFDKSDTSPGCSSTLKLDGRYIDDSSDLVDKISKNFFDPLIAVFTDNPDTWETESWIWASALFVIFLLLILCVCSSFWPQKKSHQRVVRSDDYYDSPQNSPRRKRGYEYGRGNRY